MIESEFNLTTGVDNEVTPTSQVNDDLATTQNTDVDSNVDNTQQVEQGNIQDASQELRTVPVDVVESIRRELIEAKAEKQKYLDLLIAGNQQVQQQRQQQVEEPKEEFNFNVDDDEYLDGKTLKQVLAAQKDYIFNQIKQEQQKSAGASRAIEITNYETQFSKTNPDYLDTVNSIPESIQRSLLNSFSSTKDLVENAYRIGKALKGESSQSTFKAAPKVEQQIKNNQERPKTLNSIKGTVVHEKENESPEAIFRAQVRR